jgi:hypothetical protein
MDALCESDNPGAGSRRDKEVGRIHAAPNDKADQEVLEIRCHPVDNIWFGGCKTHTQTSSFKKT